MGKKKSAGILLYRITNGIPEFFLIHPGGPFWKNKDEGAWSIPKGEFGDDEEPLEAAIREFKEETGHDINVPFIALSPIKQKGGKQVFAWAAEGDIDATQIVSNEFEIEWPPRSGKKQSFPEVDKAAWFDTSSAKQKINTTQAVLIEELISIIQP